jgi:hypothetical protein
MTRSILLMLALFVAAGVARALSIPKTPSAVA